PDRFANSPRLQQKALQKMKEINEAYDFLKSYTPPQVSRSRPTAPPPKPAQPATEPPRPRPQPAPAQERPGYEAHHAKDEIWCMRGHTDLVSSVAYSPSGKLLLSGSYDKTVR